LLKGPFASGGFALTQSSWRYLLALTGMRSRVCGPP